MRLGICELRAFSEYNLMDDLGYTATVPYKGPAALPYQALDTYYTEHTINCVDAAISFVAPETDILIDLGESVTITSIFLGTSPTASSYYSNGLAVWVGDSTDYSLNTLCGSADLQTSIFGVVECNEATG